MLCLIASAAVRSIHVSMSVAKTDAQIREACKQTLDDYSAVAEAYALGNLCLLYTSPSPRD